VKKILIGVMSLVVVLGLVGGGAFAVFSDTETSTGNTFTAGTLDLVLSNDGTNFYNGETGTWSSPANWAPGDEVKKPIYLQLVDSSVPAEAIYACWNNLINPDGMAQYIQVTWLSDSTDIGTNNIGPFVTAYDANSDGTLSLYELVNGLSFYNSLNTPDPNQARFYADEGETYAHDILPYPYAGGPAFEIMLGYKFMDSAPDSLQGKTCSFSLTFTAVQMHHGD
jgi:predicted ribosomally synthesized peptide with SipW-like signal peptide